MAAANVKAGAPVKKFGQIIGFAKVDIPAGAWIHEHNIGMGELSHDYAFAQGATQTDILPLEKQETFQGFRRANGKVGTRNYIGIMTSVNCSATVAKFIAEELNRSGILKDYKNIDGVVALKMDNGCVIDFRGAIFDVLKRTSWGYATNPEHGRRHDGGLGLRGIPDPALQGSLWNH